MPINQGRILVVDDEAQIRRLLRVSLTPQGFEILEAATAAEALKIVAKGRIELILLDLGLPDQSGFHVLEQVRQNSSVPIVVLSVRNDEGGKVRALEMGADDYVTKPFGMAELVARIRTSLRHRLQEQGATPILTIGTISIDLVKRIVRRDGAEVRLSKTEFHILGLLAEHAGKVLTHQYILRNVWGPASIDDVQYLRVYIRALRNKLEAQPDRPELLRTETGIGYRLAVPDGPIASGSISGTGLSESLPPDDVPS